MTFAPQLRKLLSRLRIERQKRDGGDYAGAEEDLEDYDDNDDSNLGDGNDDDFNWPAADVTATGGTINDSCSSSNSDILIQPTFSATSDTRSSKGRTYRSKNFGKKDIEIATDLMRELDPNNTLASAKWGQGFREEKDKVRVFACISHNCILIINIFYI